MAIKKGTTNKDKLLGGSENDSLDGLAGNDTLQGMAGNDTLIGGAGNDSLDGGNGNDKLDGGDGNDIMIGGSGDDKMNGGKGNDVLTGNAGKDTLDGGLGNDAMDGGDGDDYYIVDSIKDIVTESSKGKTGGNDTIESKSSSYTIGKNIENLIMNDPSGRGQFNGTGNELNNSIKGSIGDNVLMGLAGNDTLDGGDGEDTLDGGLGMDLLKGGNGNDIYFMNNLEDKIVETENGGNDQVFATVSFDLNANGMEYIEGLTVSGSKATDATGNELDNLLQEADGGSISNNFNGGKGDDTIEAGGGDDTIEGGEGNDSIDGGDGDDTVVFNGVQDDYMITINPDAEGVPELIVQFVNVDDEGNPNESAISDNEGTDTLLNVETLEFADGTFFNVADFFEQEGVDFTAGESSETTQPSGEVPVIDTTNAEGLTPDILILIGLMNDNV